MAWHGIFGHDRIVQQLRRALNRGRLANALLFVGPPGVGKKTFALKLAQALLCETTPEAQLDPCTQCSACQQVLADAHPDLFLVSKPKDRSFIPVERFIGDREHRMREGLCHDIALKPFRGGRKVALIDDADYLNQEGANCLLKTLEEPPPQSVLILIGTSEQKQLPTVRSRCQVIRFRPLTDEQVKQWLLSEGIASGQEEAQRLAVLARGSLQRAAQWADPQQYESRARLLDYLSEVGREPTELAKSISAFIDGAGKDASAKRERMQQVVEWAVDFYQHLMRTISGAAIPGGDPQLRRAVDRARRTWPGNEETAAGCLQRCLDAQAHIAANANLSTLLECWLDDLARQAPHGTGTV